MAEPPYRLDVHYPAHMYGGAMQLDDRIMMVAAGFGSSGMGQGNRDMNFFFKTKEERDACAERINKAGIIEAKVVRREDLDPPPNLHERHGVT